MGASPILLEPVMNVEVIVPEDFYQTLLPILIAEELRVNNVGIKGISASRSCCTIVRNVWILYKPKFYTQGSATYTMQFSDYEPVSKEVQEKVIHGGY